MIPDSHAHYLHNNDRADHLGRLILDLKPTCVIHIGDSADMPSLSTYDRGKKSFQGRTYMADIQAHLDFTDRVFSPIRRAKKKRPLTIFCEGNHEHRIKKAIEMSPELDGAISFSDLRLPDYYDTIVEYQGNTPGICTRDGINYGHYMVSGVMGRPIGGEHHGYSLITKRLATSVVGHSHLLDFCRRGTNNDNEVFGLSVGCFIDYEVDWCGRTQDLWWRGVVILHNVDNGSFDPEFLSIERLKNLYGSG